MSTRLMRRGNEAGRLLGAAALAGLLTAAAPAFAALAPDSFADLAAKVTPAVVNIAATETVNGGQQMPDMPFDFPQGSPFEQFFKQFREQQRQNGQQHAQALGSGFIIDPAGYVVTNNHVIDHAEKIQVTLADGEQFPAKLVGTDEKTDLALLKIDSDKPLPAVAFGDSDKARVGDWVLAVGNPFGLGGSVTTGIISARGRDIRSGPFDDFMQIDASINQGNSGGPTFNLDGAVIGINAAIATPNGGSVGIGFAIPSNLAKPVIAELRDHGHVERGWLGVRIQEVTPDLAQAMGLAQPAGALVADVDPDGPANGKLKPGDVILAFNDQAVEKLRDLPRLVAAAPADREAKLEIWRDSQRQTVAVQIGRLKSEEHLAANDNAAAPTADATELLGLKLARLDPRARQEFGIDDSVDGVVVLDVDANSTAADEGLRPGDVIRQVGQTQVRTPAEIDHLVAEARQKNAKSVLMLINRAGDDLFLAMNIAKA
jgi:serine protease Do